MTDEDAEESAPDDLPDEPLADLAADVREKTPGDAAAERGADSDPSAIDSGEDRDLPPLPGETEPGADRDGPLGDLAAAVDRRRGDADAGDLDDLFTSKDVADLDVDALWDQIESGGVDVAPEDAVDERVVSKGSYCEQCEFFAAPPEVGCENDGTEILELVDTDSFRVRNCPKVAEDERLGDL